MKKVLFLALAAAAFSFTACDNKAKEGAENQADAIENATEAKADAMEESADSVRDAGEATADKVEDAADSTSAAH